MQLRTVAVLPRFRGLLSDAGGAVIGFRGDALVRLEPPFEREERIARLPRDWRRPLRSLRLAERLLRLEMFRMAQTPSGTLVCIGRAGVLRRAAGAAEFRAVFRGYQGSRPVSLCTDSDGRIYVADYFSNPARGEVRVHCSEDDGVHWRTCHAFAAGEVRHVHALEWDPHRRGIWVLTGDYGDEARIGFATPGFGDYRVVARGSQRTRAFSAVALRDALVYGTDSPLEQNYMMRLDPETGALAAVAPVQHSVFFTGLACDGLFASTVVEPSEVHATQRVHVWFSADGEAWREVFSIARDRWSLRLFQFPSAFIARGPAACPYVFLSLIGGRGWDGDCLVGALA
jgi:hypothetical protein